MNTPPLFARNALFVATSKLDLAGLFLDSSS